MPRKSRPTLVARQGDVGIIRHTDLAATVPIHPVVPTDPDGSAVVARGEHTGNRHRFGHDAGVTLRCERADSPAERLLVEIGGGGEVALVHEEHGPVPVQSGDECRIQRQYSYGTAHRVED